MSFSLHVVYCCYLTDDVVDAVTDRVAQTVKSLTRDAQMQRIFRLEVLGATKAFAARLCVLSPNLSTLHFLHNFVCVSVQLPVLFYIEDLYGKCCFGFLITLCAS